MSVERRGTKALELWTKRATEGYPGVNIENMTTSWRDGLAFCALIHHFRSDLIDFKSLKSNNILENNALAYRVAEQHLGIPALLDAEDMVETEVPDRLSILTYVSQFYQAFNALGLIGRGGKRSPVAVDNSKASPIPTPPTTPKSNSKLITAVTTPATPVSLKAQPISQPPATLQTKTEKGFKTDKMLMGTRGRREECAACHKPVFLAERMVVGVPGQLRHRTCFKCARCSTQLTLASYYETENGQFCCETCPDEEKSDSSIEEQLTRDTQTKVSLPKDAKDGHESSSCDSESDSESSESSESEEQSLKITNKNNKHSIPSSSPRTKFLNATIKDDTTLSQDIPPPPKPPRVFSHPDSNQTSNDISTVTTSVEKIDTNNITNNHDMNITQECHKPADVLDTGQEKDALNLGSVQENVKIFESNDRKIALSKEDSPTDDNLVRRNSSGSKIAALKKAFETDLYKSGKVHEDSDSHTNKFLNEESELKLKASHGALEANPTCARNQEGKVTLEHHSMKDVSHVSKENYDAAFKPDDNNSSLVNEAPPTMLSALTKETLPSSTDTLKLSQTTTNDDTSNNPFGEDSEEEHFEITPKVSLLATEPGHGNSETKDIKEEKIINEETGKPDYPEELNPFDSEEESRPEIQIHHSSLPDDQKETKKPEPANETRQKDSNNQNVPENPFDSKVTEEEAAKRKEEDEGTTKTKKSLNPFWSDEEGEEESLNDSSTLSPRSKGLKPPRPPPPTLPRDSPMRKLVVPPSPTPSSRSSCSDQGALRIKKKMRQAPAPPSAETTPLKDAKNHMADASLSDNKLRTDDIKDEGFSLKIQKDMKNHSNKMIGDALQKERQMSSAVKSGILTPKSERGEWRRKKGPAPSRPVPQKRAIRKLPMRQVQQELEDIEIKQTELERQGVLIETIIRERTERPHEICSETQIENAASSESDKGPLSISSASSSTSQSGIEVEDMILQLFELVNEKNELFRRQTELMYLKREKRLEEEYAELEYQIRCLMMKSPSEKNEQDAKQEEELIERLLKVVEQRDAVVNCLEMERQREVMEDESIASHMVKYHEKIDGMESDSGRGEESEMKKKKKKLKKLGLLKKKKKKKKNKEVTTQGEDVDKDVDETEVKKEKKKWFRKNPLLKAQLNSS